MHNMIYMNKVYMAFFVIDSEHKYTKFVKRDLHVVPLYTSSNLLFVSRAIMK